MGERDGISGSDLDHRRALIGEIRAKAITGFGSATAAQDWLNRPAIGLDRRRPIDLLDTAEGCGAVAVYLDRIDRGIYA